MINWLEKITLINFLEVLFMRSFFISSGKLSEFDAGNVILLQIKVFGRNIKEATLPRYFIKVTARPSCMRLRAIG